MFKRIIAYDDVYESSEQLEFYFNTNQITYLCTDIRWGQQPHVYIIIVNTINNKTQLCFSTKEDWKKAIYELTGI